jgi:hypothetical protein
MAAQPDPARSGGAPLPRLVPPPRQVPATLRARLLFGGLGVLAWIWFGFGSAIATGFLRHADLTSWVLLRGALEEVPGTGLGCEPTGASEGGSKGQSGTPIYANRYAFGAGGDELEGVSYATGRCLGPGEAVRVEYPAGRPDRSRVQGMRRGWFGPDVLFVAIFPLVGIALVLLSLRSGWRRLRLLSRGRLALGALVSDEPTRVSVNNRPVRKLTFTIDTETMGRRQVVVRSHVPELALDEPRERILYDPERPELAAAWDLLPTIRLDERGELAPAGLAGSLLVLLPPVLAVIGHLVALGLVGP